MEDLIIVSVFHLVLFSVASILIYRSKSVDLGRKKIQVLFSLFVPFLGPILSIIVHLSDVAKVEAISSRYYGQSIDDAPWDIKLYYMTHPENRGRIRMHQLVKLRHLPCCLSNF